MKYHKHFRPFMRSEKLLHLSFPRDKVFWSANSPVSHKTCDPTCLLQRPRNLNVVQKLARRGCKKLFWRAGERAPEFLASVQPCFAPVQPSFAPMQQAFGPHTHTKNTFCTLSYPLWASLRVPASAAGTSGRNTRPNESAPAAEPDSGLYKRWAFAKGGARAPLENTFGYALHMF